MAKAKTNAKGKNEIQIATFISVELSSSVEDYIDKHNEKNDSPLRMTKSGFIRVALKEYIENHPVGK